MLATYVITLQGFVIQFIAYDIGANYDEYQGECFSHVHFPRVSLLNDGTGSWVMVWSQLPSYRKTDCKTVMTVTYVVVYVGIK